MSPFPRQPMILFVVYLRFLFTLYIYMERDLRAVSDERYLLYFNC